MSKATNLLPLHTWMGLRGKLDGIQHIVQPYVLVECVGWRNPRGTTIDTATRLYRTRTAEVHFSRSFSGWGWSVVRGATEGERRIGLRCGNWSTALEWFSDHFMRTISHEPPLARDTVLAFPLIEAGYDSERIYRAFRSESRRCSDRLGRGSEV